MSVPTNGITSTLSTGGGASNAFNAGNSSDKPEDPLCGSAISSEKRGATVSNHAPVATNDPKLPFSNGWKCCVHPEGWTYFYKVDKDESDIVESHEICGALSGTKQAGPGATIPAVRYGGLHVKIYIDHTRWYAAKDRNHLGGDAYRRANKLQLDYWEFMRDFPAHQSLPHGAVTAACQALHCHVMEGIMQRSDTLAPFTLPESQELLHYLDRDSNRTTLADGPPPPTALLPSQSSMKTRLISWVLLNVAQHRIASRYGCKTFQEAKQDALRFLVPSRPTFWFTLISTIFLLAPLEHRMHIHVAKQNSELRGDIDTWPAYVDTLVREWNTFNLAATVLLSASVGFLGVPGIGSVARTVALLSVVFTLGSIMCSVYLIWRHQGGRRRIEYNISLLEPGVQVNALAIILSLPFVTLAWGVILFLVSVILYSYFGFQSTFTGGNMHVRAQSWVPIISSSSIVVVTMLGGFAFVRFSGKYRMSSLPV